MHGLPLWAGLRALVLLGERVLRPSPRRPKPYLGARLTFQLPGNNSLTTERAIFYSFSRGDTRWQILN